MTIINVLFVCTAGRCRSPIAAALLERQLREFDSRFVVSSGGVKYGGEPMPTMGVSRMAEHGFDLTRHRSTPVTAQSISEADIVLAMAREHVREILAIVPEAWSKTFTLKDFVRRAERVGRRGRRQRLSDWLEIVGDGRSRHDVLGDSPDDDVLDPYGQRIKVWDRVIDEIDDLVSRTVPTLGLRKAA